MRVATESVRFTYSWRLRWRRAASTAAGWTGGPTEYSYGGVDWKPLAFDPQQPQPLDQAARDLIAGLLVKNPAHRVGSRCGSADVKPHPFFKEVNLALLRSCAPPVVPGLKRAASHVHVRPKPDPLGGVGEEEVAAVAMMVVVGGGGSRGGGEGERPKNDLRVRELKEGNRKNNF